MPTPRKPANLLRHPVGKKLTKNATTSPVAIQRYKDMEKALNLRLQGRTFAEIAKAMKLGRTAPDKGSAMRLVDEAMMQIIQEPAEQVLRLELARLDQLLTSIWKEAMAGDNTAFQNVMKIMDRRAKYLGLDKPVDPRDAAPPGDVHINVLFVTPKETEG